MPLLLLGTEANTLFWGEGKRLHRPFTPPVLWPQGKAGKAGKASNIHACIHTQEQFKIPSSQPSEHADSTQTGPRCLTHDFLAALTNASPIYT